MGGKVFAPPPPLMGLMGNHVYAYGGYFIATRSTNSHNPITCPTPLAQLFSNTANRMMLKV